MMDERLWNGEGVLGALREVWEHSAGVLPTKARLNV